MKAGKKKKKSEVSQLDFMKSIRKPMPPPVSVHGEKKYKRDKDWKRDIGIDKAD
jgi:hypothetical protein